MSLLPRTSRLGKYIITRAFNRRSVLNLSAPRRADIPEAYLRRGVKKRLDKAGVYKGEVDELPELQSHWDLNYPIYTPDDYTPWSWQKKLGAFCVFWGSLILARYCLIFSTGQYSIRVSELPELEVLEDYGLEHLPEDSKFRRGMKPHSTE